VFDGLFCGVCGSVVVCVRGSCLIRMSWPILAPPITETNGQIRGIHIHRFRKEGRKGKYLTLPFFESRRA
jgi:hypothetical protein